MCHHIIVNISILSSMTTLHCDYHMNLPSDAFTMLMVITCALIYVVSYCRDLNYYNPVYMYLLH